jgi:hypothetical protein
VTNVKLDHGLEQMNLRTAVKQQVKKLLGVTDLENQFRRLATHDLVRQLEIRAHASSAEFIEKTMGKAKALDSVFSVIDFALTKTSKKRSQLFCEFGVYKGTTINHIARQIKSKIYGFDSFQGLPEHWRDGFPAGTFDLASQGLPKCEPNVELVVGWFDATLPQFVTEHTEPISFLHVDCDLYSSTKTVFDHLGKQLISGSVIVFDEYFNYPGWQEHEHLAFKEFIDCAHHRFEYLCYNRFHEQVAVQIL